MFQIAKMAHTRYKMNETVTMFLFGGDKLASDMPLRPSEFTYSACGSFTINQRMQKLKK